MKKYPFLVLALLIVVVSASGCVSNQNQTNVTSYSQNNVSFNYPSSWQTANATSPNAVAAVADPNTVDSSTKVPTTLVVIQKSNASTGSSLQTIYNSNYATFFNNTSYQRVSEGNITVSGSNALENVYTTNSSTGAQLEMKAVWISQNNNIYVILCSSLASDFQNQQSNFDTIIDSFKAS
ncbi:PsbP-related protein [Methanobacterium paludis]|uniref:PsbP C-terminal domain-containing protein n=1 Tax=Methanobacterium paludis (strain DSM 25820 / JCM 18151 / SWAN1) TaxID=868131 RepID=F6D3F9_METPW|nr:PsbP-related protein [Methanobacterium paludis]AEG19135.1 hypothetical protein MSWAN_2127 [Methanobacterium paludis]